MYKGLVAGCIFVDDYITVTFSLSLKSVILVSNLEKNIIKIIGMTLSRLKNSSDVWNVSLLFLIGEGMEPV